MSARFEFVASALPGLTLVRRRPMGDERGWLERLFCDEEFSTLMPGQHVAQINRTLTLRRGTVRGMHYQIPPHGETKLVSCTRGAVFDVAVDVRQGSPTFLKWHAELLTADNRHSLLIPPGFAHGFQALENDCELIYLHSARYVPHAEAGLNARDPRLSIEWPEPIVTQSPRDLSMAAIDEKFPGVRL